MLLSEVWKWVGLGRVWLLPVSLVMCCLHYDDVCLRVPSCVEGECEI